MTGLGDDVMLRAPGIVSVSIGLIILGFATLYYLCLKLLIAVPEEVVGLLIGIGITLLATGLNEVSKFYGSTTELENLSLT